MNKLIRASRLFRIALCACALYLGFGSTSAHAAVTFSTSTFAGYLITPQLISVTSSATMKILVVNTTGPSVSASLCLGTTAQFQQSVCGTQLTYSKEGPGVAIIDPTMLNGLVLYVLKGPNGSSVSFTITID